MGNVRFWVWHNDGWVKMTLKPGQSLYAHSSGYTDEGWWSEGEEWVHEGDRVIRRWHWGGLDCDGRLERGGEFSCAISDLAALDMLASNGDDDSRGIHAPDWQRAEAWQRDHAAEAAGY